MGAGLSKHKVPKAFLLNGGRLHANCERPLQLTKASFVSGGAFNTKKESM